METIKSYTDIFQSRKLAEILPIESADMYYSCGATAPDVMVVCKQDYKCYTICWSLAALLEVIRNNGRYELQMYEGGYYLEANGFMTESYFNPIDACVEMIVQLKEGNLL